jgi:hypothetical protein
LHTATDAGRALSPVADHFEATAAEDGQKPQAICAPQDKELRDSGHLKFVGSLGMPDQSNAFP